MCVKVEKSPELGFSISGGVGGRGNPFRPEDNVRLHSEPLILSLSWLHTIQLWMQFMWCVTAFCPVPSGDLRDEGPDRGAGVQGPSTWRQDSPGNAFVYDYQTSMDNRACTSECIIYACIRFAVSHMRNTVGV